MIIAYTGIGAKKNGIHTEQEFLDIMNREFTHKDWNNCVSWFICFNNNFLFSR